MNTRITRACAAALAVLLLATGSAWAAKGDTPETKAPAEKPSAPAASLIAPDTPADQIALRLSPLTAEDLAEEAKLWQALLKTKTQEVVELRLARREATGEEADRLVRAIVPVSAQRGALSSGLEQILEAWAAKGGDPEKIEPYRKYIAAASAEQIRGAQASTLWAELVKWLSADDGGLALLASVALVAVALAVLWTLARLAAALVRRAVSRVPNLSALLRDFVTRSAFWAVMGAGTLIVLATLGVHVGGLLALVGGASFVLAFAMQNTLSSFAAGLMIMVYRPFDVGDQVEVAGASGTVQSVSLVSTTIVTADNRIVVIPNGNVWGSVITNASGSRTRRVDLAFTIGRQDDALAAQRILEEIVSAHPQVLEAPPPIVRLREFGESSVRFSCEAWTSTADYWTVYWDVMRQVKERFDAASIANGAVVEAAPGA